MYAFKTLRSGESWSPRIAMYGDMGTDGQSLPYLKDEAKQGNFDVILHVGKHLLLLRWNVTGATQWLNGCALDSRSSGPGSSLDLNSWPRHFTLTVPLHPGV